MAPDNGSRRDDSPGHSRQSSRESQEPERPPLIKGVKKSVSFLRDPPEVRTTRSASARKSSLKVMKRADELSPLISPRTTEEVETMSMNTDLPSPTSSDEEEDYFGVVPQESKSTWYLMLLTVGIGGLQIAWSVELAYGSPYLLGLGISKSLLAFVWIAGPLSGTLVQPYVGIKSDSSRSKWGKRRPFIVGGGLATIVALFALAWAREVVTTVLGIFGVDKEDPAILTVASVFAVLLIYILDFAINVIQASIRAFIVDNAPAHQQNDANAWASRMSGVGNILGYVSGYVDLPKILPFFGDTQFKVLCVIACLAMTLTVGLSVITVSERDASKDEEPEEREAGVFAFFKNLIRSMRRLPPQISKVCQVQFFAWIGWFPFLFYTTTYVGEIYARPYYAANPNMSDEEIDEIWERGTRVATFSLLIFACATLASSVFLPLIIQPTFAPPEPSGAKTPLTPGVRTPGAITPGSLGGTDYFGDFRPSMSRASSYAFSIPKTRKQNWFERTWEKISSMQLPGFTLRRAYILSHIAFALLTAMTFFVHDTNAATALIACVGIPWSITNWAPFALIAAEIGKREAIKRGEIPAPQTEDGQALASGEDPAQGADQAGVVLGIHNVAIAAPQVIATLVSSIIFKLLQKPRGSTDDDSVAWVLRFGGCAALVAAYLTTRLEEEDPIEAEPGMFGGGGH